MANQISSSDQAFAVSTTETHTEAEWATIIRADLGRALEGLISAGQHLIAAKFQHGHGRFLALLRTIDMHERTAERLMSIADNVVLTNPTHGSRLPKSMRTLYELSRLPIGVLEAKLIDGTITPKIERKDVAALKPKRGEKPGSSVRPEAESKDDIIRRLEEENERFRRAGEDLFSSGDSAADIALVIVSRLLLLTPTKAKQVLELAPGVYAEQLASRDADEPKPKRTSRKKRRTADDFRRDIEARTAT